MDDLAKWSGRGLMVGAYIFLASMAGLALKIPDGGWVVALFPAGCMGITAVGLALHLPWWTK